MQIKEESGQSMRIYKEKNRLDYLLHMNQDIADVNLFDEIKSDALLVRATFL